MNYMKGYAAIVLGAVLTVIYSNAAKAGSFSDSLYIGGGTSIQSATTNFKDPDVKTDSVKLTSFEGVAGYRYNEYLSAEARGGVGVSSDVMMNSNIKYKERYSLGAYVLAGYPVLDVLDIYTLLGYHFAQSSLNYEEDGAKNNISFNISGITYGVGARFSVTPKVDLTYEIMSSGKGTVSASKDGKTSKIADVNKYNLNLGARYNF